MELICNKNSELTNTTNCCYTAILPLRIISDHKPLDYNSGVEKILTFNIGFASTSNFKQNCIDKLPSKPLKDTLNGNNEMTVDFKEIFETLVKEYHYIFIQEFKMDMKTTILKNLGYINAIENTQLESDKTYYSILTSTTDNALLTIWKNSLSCVFTQYTLGNDGKSIRFHIIDLGTVILINCKFPPIRGSTTRENHKLLLIDLRKYVLSILKKHESSGVKIIIGGDFNIKKINFRLLGNITKYITIGEYNDYIVIVNTYTHVSELNPDAPEFVPYTYINTHSETLTTSDEQYNHSSGRLDDNLLQSIIEDILDDDQLLTYDLYTLIETDYMTTVYKIICNYINKSDDGKEKIKKIKKEFIIFNYNITLLFSIYFILKFLGLLTENSSINHTRKYIIDNTKIISELKEFVDPTVIDKFINIFNQIEITEEYTPNKERIDIHRCIIKIISSGQTHIMSIGSITALLIKHENKIKSKFVIKNRIDNKLYGLQSTKAVDDDTVSSIDKDTVEETVDKDTVEETVEKDTVEETVEKDTVEETVKKDTVEETVEANEIAKYEYDLFINYIKSFAEYLLNKRQTFGCVINSKYLKYKQKYINLKKKLYINFHNH